MMKNIKLYTHILFTFITLQTYGMNLFVQTPNNGTISLDVEPSDSGENIKNKIFDQISIPVINQVISWNGTTIQDGQTLADFGIVNNSTIVLTVTTTTQVPEKMSYQAVVRNAANQLVINQNVGVKFSILKSSATGAVVYAETQNSTTNSNGLFTTNIGSGTVISGSMASINWANDVYFIKSEIDLAGGSNYTITGTQQLLSVPYALNAKNGIPNGGTANQVLAKVDGTDYTTQWITPSSGTTLPTQTGNDGKVLTTNGSTLSWETPNATPSQLEVFTTASGAKSYRIFERDTNNYGTLGNDAVDLSYSDQDGSNNGATGNGTFTAGYNNKASADGAVALGALNNASGLTSTALGVANTASGRAATVSGFQNTASGGASTAMGFAVNAIGDGSVALGAYLNARSPGEIVVGTGNTDYVPADSSEFNSADRAFVVGIGEVGLGSVTSRKDGLIVYKDGTLALDKLASAPAITQDRLYVLNDKLHYNGTEIGQDLPTGGTTGQVLAKVDGTDYNTQWVTPSAGGSGAQVALIATKTTNPQVLSLANGVNTGDLVTFDNVVTSNTTFGSYNTATSTFTVNQAGVYCIQATARTPDAPTPSNTVNPFLFVDFDNAGITGINTMITDYPAVNASFFPSGVKGKGFTSVMMYLTVGQTINIKGLSANLTVQSQGLNTNGTCKFMIFKM